MIRHNSSVPQHETMSPGDLAIPERFDYSPLSTEVAQQAQTAAERIRCMVKRTLEDLLAVGEDLVAVKQALPHGSFGPWLRAEFGWSERTARNFMAVAERFGSKSATISDLHIEPTAAYLLAAPSVPEAASEAAIQRAESGERITGSVAKEIVRKVRNRAVPCKTTRQSTLPEGKLLGQLLESLESFRRRWNPRQFPELAQHLREFADSLEEE